jgi:hypothetical protein
MTERDPIDNAALEILEEFNALIQEYDNRDVVRAVTGILATTVYAASNSPTKPASWSTLSQLRPDYRRHARGREGQQTQLGLPIESTYLPADTAGMAKTRGRIHPFADIGGEARSPDHREGRVAKRPPS